MTKYKCLNCGWEGEDIIKWEEHPRDEFWLKCPNCHHIDEYIQVLDGEVWIPAVICREPTLEEIERSERSFQRLNELASSNNVYLETIYKMQRGKKE